jgi:hypothetical protein
MLVRARSAAGALRHTATAVTLLLLAACAQTQSNTVEGLATLPPDSRIILMPLDIELGLLNAGGIVEPRADWTEAARGHLNTALESLIDDADTDLIVDTRIDPYADLDDVEIQLVKLHGALGLSILLHQYEPALKLPSRPPGFDWSLGPEVRRLKEQYGTDYALFVYIRDSYSSSGRAAVVALGLLLGIGVQGGTQVGFASLVDLDTGQIVWFNRLISATGDLRTAEAAKTSADALAAGFPK